MNQASVIEQGVAGCPLCLGTGKDVVFGGRCSDCFPAHDDRRFLGLRAAVSDPARRLPTRGERVDRDDDDGDDERPGRVVRDDEPRVWGWAKHGDAWVACAPIGSKIEAGQVTLRNRQGKETTVWITGRILATKKWGRLCELDVERNSAEREDARAAKATARAQTPAVNLNLTLLPSGTYMVPGCDVRFGIDAVEKGKWSGWVFVRNATEYNGAGNRIGKQAPGQGYQGRHADELDWITEHPLEAAQEYGRRTGTRARSCRCSAPAAARSPAWSRRPTRRSAWTATARATRRRTATSRATGSPRPRTPCARTAGSSGRATRSTASA